MTNTAETPEIVSPDDVTGWSPLMGDADVLPRLPDESEIDYRRLLLICRQIKPWERTTARIAHTLELGQGTTGKLMRLHDWRARFVIFDDHQSRELAGAIRYATARAAVSHVKNLTVACKVVAAGLDDMLEDDGPRPPASIAALLRAVDSSVVGTLAPAVADHLADSADEITAANSENLADVAAALEDPETLRLAAELRAHLDGAELEVESAS